MSQKLWNKVKKKTKAYSVDDLVQEYQNILEDISKEAIERKNEIIQICLISEYDTIWNLIEKEYRAIRFNEEQRKRQEDLETLVKDHHREFARSGSHIWIVEYERVENDSQSNIELSN